MQRAAPLVKAVDFAALGRAGSAGHAQARGILLSEGAVEFSLDRRVALRAGQLYVIPPRVPHAFFGASVGGARGWTFDLAESFSGITSRNFVTRLDEQKAAELSAWLSRIDVEQRRGDACANALSEALYRAVSIECARTIGIASCSSHSRIVTDALQIMSREYASALRPRDIAARVGVTPAHLSHEVRRQTGRPPSDWICQARIDAAKLLLVSSAQSVSAIAACVGYGDVSQLNRQFRQTTGASPDAWRRTNKRSRSAS